MRYDNAISLGVIVHAIIMIILFGGGVLWLGMKCGNLATQIKRLADIVGQK